MSNDAASFSKMVDSLLQGMQAVVRQIDRVATDLSEVKADIRRLRADVVDSSAKVESLARGVDEMRRATQESFRAVGQRFDGLESEIERIGTRTSAGISEIAHVQVQILNAVQAANAVRIEFQDHDERLRAVEDKVSGLGM